MSPRRTAKSELTVTEDDVRSEVTSEVNVPAHWIYMLAVIAGSLVLMVALMAFLGAQSAA